MGQRACWVAIQTQTVNKKIGKVDFSHERTWSFSLVIFFQLSSMLYLGACKTSARSIGCGKSSTDVKVSTMVTWSKNVDFWEVVFDFRWSRPDVSPRAFWSAFNSRILISEVWKDKKISKISTFFMIFFRSWSTIFGKMTIFLSSFFLSVRVDWSLIAHNPMARFMLHAVHMPLVM